MYSIVRLVVCVLLFMPSLKAFADDTPPPPKPVPSFLLEPKGCAILVSGSVGVSFADPAVSKLWFELNKSVSDYLYQELALDRYRVVRLIVSVAQARDMVNLLMQAMATHRCSRVLQLSTDVGEDSDGRYFGFTLGLIRLVPAPGAAVGGTNTVTEGEYSRRYRYPRDIENLDKFRTGTFAHQAFTDIKAAGALEPLAAQ